MSTLSRTFSQKADERDVLGASLQLIGADTRQGMDAKTRAALAVVLADGTPQHKGYASRYEAAAGRAGAPRMTTNSAPKF
jgi:hypothetical protein